MAPHRNPRLAPFNDPFFVQQKTDFYRCLYHLQKSVFSSVRIRLRPRLVAKTFSAYARLTISTVIVKKLSLHHVSQRYFFSLHPYTHLLHNPRKNISPFSKNFTHKKPFPEKRLKVFEIFHTRINPVRRGFHVFDRERRTTLRRQHQRL